MIDRRRFSLTIGALSAPQAATPEPEPGEAQRVYLTSTSNPVFLDSASDVVYLGSDGT